MTALAEIQTSSALPQEMFGVDEKYISPDNYQTSIDLLNSMDRAILPTEKLDILKSCVSQVQINAPSLIDLLNETFSNILLCRFTGKLMAYYLKRISTLH